MSWIKELRLFLGLVPGRWIFEMFSALRTIDDALSNRACPCVWLVHVCRCASNISLLSALVDVWVVPPYLVKPWACAIVFYSATIRSSPHVRPLSLLWISFFPSRLFWRFFLSRHQILIYVFFPALGRCALSIFASGGLGVVLFVIVEGAFN